MPSARLLPLHFSPRALTDICMATFLAVASQKPTKCSCRINMHARQCVSPNVIWTGFLFTLGAALVTLLPALLWLVIVMMAVVGSA